MLNISFFFAAFASISWLIFSIRFLHITSLYAIRDIAALYQIVMVILFPLATIWGIVAIIKSFYTEKNSIRSTLTILDQLKKNVENTNTLNTNLNSAEKEIKNILALNNTNTLISDINEILSDIIKRSNSISSAQIEYLWTRTAGGERWLIAKTFIETNSFQPGFADHLLNKAQKDSLLKGNILEFQARYKNLIQLLQAYDSHNLFLSSIEYGAFGKVYSIITPIAAALNREPVVEKKAPKIIKAPIERTTSEEEFPSFLSDEKKDFQIQSPKISIENTPRLSTDESLQAIRDELLTPEPKAPQIQTPIITSFSKTQSALRNLNKEATVHTPAPRISPEENPKNRKIISLSELEEEINSSPDNNYDEFAYPFGAWLDDKASK